MHVRRRWHDVASPQNLYTGDTRKRGFISNYQMKQSRPLTLEVVGVADDDHLQQVGVGDVGGPQRHHQVPEADERAVPVGEDRHDHVVLVVRKQTGVTTLPDTFFSWSYK